MNVALTVGVAIEEGPPGAARAALVTLDVHAVTDRRFQPYTARVRIGGVFAAPNEMAEADFYEFCRRAAPTILFPYARNMIHQISADAPSGPIRLNPVNLTDAFASAKILKKQPNSPRDAD